MIFWNFLSFLGSKEFYLLIMPALLWCVNARLGLRVGVLFLLSANLNGALKLLFHMPRPAWLDAKIIAYASEASFGFPSGHAQNAVAVWGLLAAKAKTRLAWGIALVLCVFIGLSRLALNVHFPGDVLGGWLFGAILLGAFLKLEKPVGAWLKERDFVQQIVVCAAASLLFAALNWYLPWHIYQEITSGAPWYAELSQLNPKALFGNMLFVNSMSRISNIQTSGARFGFLIGACWILKNGGYIDGGNKITRYLIGLLGVGIFWFGLDKILPHGEDIVSLGAAYMHYALVGFWISAGAPLIFRKLESPRPIHPNPLHSS